MKSTKVLLKYCFIGVFVFTLYSCADKTNLTEPTTEKPSLAAYQEQTIAESEVEPNLYKINHLNTSDHASYQGFLWSKPVYSFHANDSYFHIYTFDHLAVFVDGTKIHEDYSYLSTGTLLYLPEDYKWHTWQVKAVYKDANNSPKLIEYNYGEAFSFRIGIPAPELSININNPAPSLTWTLVDNNIMYYTIHRSLTPNGIFEQIGYCTNTNYIDSEVTINSNGTRTAYYKIYAWAQGSLMIFPSQLSNMVSVTIN